MQQANEPEIYASMSIDMSDIAELRRALSKTVQLEKVEKKAAIAAHTKASFRIFPSSGGSKDKEDRRLGTYSSNTMKIRRKANWTSGRAIILQFSRQLIHSWDVVVHNGAWTSLFNRPGRRRVGKGTGKVPSNDQVADRLEVRYGKIFERTEKEEDFFIEKLEKYQAQLLNK